MCIRDRVSVPSLTHEGLILLFRNRPELAPELLRDSLKITLPAYSEVRLESADITDVSPAEYRADLVVLLVDGKPVLGIVVEVQLQRDERKRFTWPVYVMGLRARLSCPACVLVFTLDERTAEWCREPIVLGPGNIFTPLVLGPSAMPLITDLEMAMREPELAVLSTLAHGTSENGRAVAEAALKAALGLTDERRVLYSDLVVAAVGKATRLVLEELMATGNYVFQSEYFKNLAAKFERERLEQAREEGRVEAREEGRVGEARAKLLTLIEARGLGLSEVQRSRVTECEDHARLDAWFLRAANATSSATIFTDGTSE